jgi:hypothetical protein
MIRSTSVAVTFRFGTIDLVLGGGESSIIGGSSGTEGQSSGTSDSETSEEDEEELSGSRGGCSGVPSVIVTNVEEMSSSASRDCTRSKKIVTSR